MDTLTKLRVEWNRTREEQRDVLHNAHAQLGERRREPDRYIQRKFFGFKEPLLLRAGELRRIGSLDCRAGALTNLEEMAKSGEIKGALVQSRNLLEKAIRKAIRREAGLKAAVGRGQL